MFKSYAASHMNMKADIYIQKPEQSATGVITRKWLYEKTVDCRAEAVDQFRFFKKIDRTVDGFFDETYVRLKTIEPISRRWRISTIRGNNGKDVFQELDKISQDNTIFEVRESHAVTDPFGNISYYETLLRRAVVQENDIYSG